MATMPVTTTAPTGRLAALVMDLKRKLEALPHTRKLTDADVEAIYTLAYREFSQARYEEALHHFQLLLVYRPTHKVYLLGAALCLQRLRRYELAMAAYVALRYLDPQQPRHTLALAECQLLAHEHGAARDTLERAIEFCNDNAGHDTVRDRARAMLELMNPRHEPAHHPQSQPQPVAA